MRRSLLDVLLGVQARALRRALGLDQPARLVHAQRLRVHVGELGGHRDHEHAAVGRDLDARDRSARAPAPCGAAPASPLGGSSPLTSRRRAHCAAPRRSCPRAPARTGARAGRRSMTCESSSTASAARRELVGNVDHEAVVDVAVARPGSPSFGGPSPRRRWTVPCLVPGLHPQRLGAVERRHLHLGAAQRLGDRQRDLDLDVVALALEHRRRRDVGDQVEVAGRAAAATRLALARRGGCGCRRARRRGCSRAGA